MKRKIVTVGICAVMMLVVFSSGCFEEQKDKMYIWVYNRCNEELKVNISVDGKSLGYVYVSAGDHEILQTEYLEGHYTEKGYHRIKLSTIYHDGYADISESVAFYLHADGSVTYRNRTLNPKNGPIQSLP